MLRVHMAGVGGQGTQTASRILGEAAMASDVLALVAALHGMAQRGGSVTNQVLLGGVRSPVIEPGEADVLLGFEPIEAARWTHIAREGALIIVSTDRIVPFTLTAAGASYPDLEILMEPLRRIAGSFHTLSATSIARRAGNVRAVGPVMLGALAATGVLPLPAAHLRSAIAQATSAGRRASSLHAFDLGHMAIAEAS